MTTKWLALPLLLASIPGVAQYQNQGRFNNGLRDGGRHGDYYGQDRRYNNGYDDRYRNDNRYRNDDRNRGGIGPGKGALIGGAGGAVLGALLGGGLKGAIIGGGAGAGVGAVAGKVHQDHRRDNDYYYGR